MKNGDYILVLAPAEFPGRKYRNRYCYEHHLVYWLHKNHVPAKNECIHHIDGDKHNNNIDNLVLLNVGNHVREHHTGRIYLDIKCPACGKIFSRERRQTFLSKNSLVSCCSKRCGLQISKLPMETKRELGLQSIIREYVV